MMEFEAFVHINRRIYDDNEVEYYWEVEENDTQCVTLRYFQELRREDAVLMNEISMSIKVARLVAESILATADEISKKS